MRTSPSESGLAGQQRQVAGDEGRRARQYVPSRQARHDGQQLGHLAALELTGDAGAVLVERPGAA